MGKWVCYGCQHQSPLQPLRYYTTATTAEALRLVFEFLLKNTETITFLRCNMALYQTSNKMKNALFLILLLALHWMFYVVYWKSFLGFVLFSMPTAAESTLVMTLHWWWWRQWWQWQRRWWQHQLQRRWRWKIEFFSSSRYWHKALTSGRRMWRNTDSDTKDERWSEIQVPVEVKL